MMEGMLKLFSRINQEFLSSIIPVIFKEKV
jgi:hypothetical protein